ncbi:hypothetical protein [Treponema succinifaciens]|uniref:hypothetical protein n=1 Tax=Treponema succinifaciens TaxID=167 RepID=UPI003FCE5A47
MKFKKNNVKIEITETKDDKICIDITTSKEVVVNVGKDSSEIIFSKKNLDLIKERLGTTDIATTGDVNAAFDLTDIVIRDFKNNKEQ